MDVEILQEKEEEVRIMKAAVDPTQRGVKTKASNKPDVAAGYKWLPFAVSDGSLQQEYIMILSFLCEDGDRKVPSGFLFRRPDEAIEPKSD